jgi:hypothetical protein
MLKKNKSKKQNRKKKKTTATVKNSRVLEYSMINVAT